MTDAWIRIINLVCLFGAVLLAVEVLVSGLARARGEGRAINLRLKLIGRGFSRGEAMSLLRRRDNVIPAGLPPWAADLALKFERMLIASGVTMPTPQLMMILLIAPVALFGIILLLMLLLGSPFGVGRLLMVGTFAGLAGFLLPMMFLNFKANRRRKKMEEQFPVALDVFVRGLRAGHPVASALELLTVEMPDPIGSQFGIVVDEVTYGADFRDALQNMADRWGMDDMRMFVVSLSVQSETGGNLAEILENLSKVIRDRQSMMMKVRALSSEGRMTAVILTILPVLAFAALFLLNPPFYLEVADDPAFVPGFVGLILLYAIGFYTIRRMVDLKV